MALFTTASRIFSAGAIATCLAGTALQAQQGISLKIRPKVGDTIHIVMEQKFEILRDAGTAESAKDSSSREIVVGSKEAAAGVKSSIFSAHVNAVHRFVVLEWDGEATKIDYIPGRVDISPADALELPMFASMKARSNGEKIVFKIKPDGGAVLTSGPKDGSSSEVIWSHLPAVLPLKDVSVGEKWIKEMQLSAASAQGHGGGSVKAHFKFDSISKDARYAYISMSGNIKSPSSSPSAELESGSISGTIQMDRKLGWVAESTFTMSIISMMKISRNEPMKRVTMKVSQTMKLDSPTKR